MKVDGAAIMEGLKALGARFDELNLRFDGLSSRVDGLSSRVDGLSSRVDGLNTRVDEGFARLDREVVDFRAENRRITGTVTRLEGKMDDVAARMATKDDISTVLGHVDGLAGRVHDMNLRWANHDDRISALEKRRPT